MERVWTIERHGVQISPRLGGNRSFFVLYDDQYYMGVADGASFGLYVNNTNPTMRAFPFVVVDRGGSVRNIFMGNDETDPNLFPSDGGMYEAAEPGSGYEELLVSNFKTPAGEYVPFVFREGTVVHGVNYPDFPANVIRVYVRTPVDSEMTYARALAPSAGSVSTGVEYNRDAQLVAEITVLPANEVSRMLGFTPKSLD